MLETTRQDPSDNAQVVLVPLDESRRAELALDLATQIARRTGSSLTLLTVPLLHQDPSSPPVTAVTYPAAASIKAPEELVESSRVEALEYLTSMQGRLAAGEVPTDLRVVHRSPAEAIVEVAEELGAALIVMATHGRSGFTRWALGSVADKVLQTARTPVLFTRQGGSWGGVGPRNILVALDGSPLAESVLPEVEWLAGHFGAEITLAQVLPKLDYCIGDDDGGSENRDHAAAYLDERAQALTEGGFRARTELLVAENVAEALLDLDAQESVDLLAMTTHGRGGIKRWAYGSVADRMIRSATTPVLLVRATESDR